MPGISARTDGSIHEGLLCVHGLLQSVLIFCPLFVFDNLQMRDSVMLANLLVLPNTAHTSKSVLITTLAQDVAHSCLTSGAYGGV